MPYPHLLNFFQSTPRARRRIGRRSSTGFWSISACRRRLWARKPGRIPLLATSPYLPPFNRISAYREPGRINLNTIYTPEVFQGLMAGFPDMANATFWQKFVQSRRGDSQPNVLAAPATTVPTEFARPFRSFGGWNMTVPAIQPSITREIECTLLRSDTPAGSNRPLFQFDSALPGTIGSYNDPNRNPFFRYQGLQRLGNLVTTRSNVYAVWITVGYFEVTPWPTGRVRRHADAVHPDGYQLGRELGSDTGDIERHRAFYIFDRTMPVGFQRGQDLNVDKAILMSRFIE